MKKITVICFMAIFIIGIVSATETKLFRDDIKVQVLNNKLYLIGDTNFYDKNNASFDLFVSNSTANLPWQLVTFFVGYTIPDTPGLDFNCTQSLINCEVEKGKFDMALSARPTKDDIAIAEANLTQCRLDYQRAQGDIQTSNAKVTDLETWKKDHENSNWLFLGLGAAGGLLAMYWWKGNLTKVKDKETYNFNDFQSS